MHIIVRGEFWWAKHRKIFGKWDCYMLIWDGVGGKMRLFLKGEVLSIQKLKNLLLLFFFGWRPSKAHCMKPKLLQNEVSRRRLSTESLLFFENKETFSPFWAPQHSYAKQVKNRIHNIFRSLCSPIRRGQMILMSYLDFLIVLSKRG